MADTKRRVHHLAKDLEVSSKVIIEKCEAEGIQIKNHMHVLSAGLEATIREWFSEGAHKTTVETADRVDLKKVRVRRKSTKATTTADGDHDTGSEDDAETSAPTETTTAVMDAPTIKAPPISPSHPTDDSADEKSAVEDQPTESAPDKPAVAAEVVEPPSAPETVIPAPEIAPMPETPAAAATEADEKQFTPGPQNVPSPAKLTGPKVIRMDRPEYVDRPRPAARGPARGPALPAAPKTVVPSDDDEMESRRGRGGGKKPAGAGDAAARRTNPRRGIRDERELASEQLKEWKERELLEMRDRLAAASGRGIGGLRAVEKKGGPSRGPLHARRQKAELSEPILVKDFCRECGIGLSALNKQLGTLMTINSVLDGDQAQLIAAEQGIELVVIKAKTPVEKLADRFAEIKRKSLLPRPPIVTVLGHVDHGKTSLLDRIRQANVASGEAGGITQHVGAYRVKVGERWVTFLDTPGHAAFTAMRARGANITDVVVLVVAADDGIMPTTVEAINHARAANATIVVALNKIDLSHDINKLYGQLAEHGLTPSGDWGGETDVVKTSAVTGEGIDELLNHLATLSDVLELKADPTIAAMGTVIEARRDEKVGPVARVIVQEGTLKAGQTVVCGAAHGRVRALVDDKEKTVAKAGPAMPVALMGLNDVPEAGEKFYVVTNAREAKEIAEEMAARKREGELVRLNKPRSLESMFAAAAEGEIPELNLIVRADVQGSIDALRQELHSFPSDEVKLTILHSGVGTVTDSDISLAEASDAIIIAFHVVPEPSIQRRADTVGVEIRTYKIIYEAKDDIKKALEGLLEPEQKIESRGRAEVREVFNLTKIGRAAGCFVRDGVINRNHLVRVVRDGVVVKDNGTLESLRRFKDDAKEVKSGFECGLKIANFDDVKPGDVIESFEIVKVARTLKTGGQG